MSEASSHGGGLQLPENPLENRIVALMARPSPFHLALLLVTATVGCAPDRFPNDEELVRIRAVMPPAKLPEDPTNRVSTSAQAAVLGKRLFDDEGFSPCAMACKSCHIPPTYTEPVARTKGCAGTPLNRNAPTLLNVGYYSWFHWDGERDSLWAQAIGPLTNPLEMNADPVQVKARMSQVYLADYQELFGASPVDHSPDQILANFGKAIDAYLRTLGKLDSAFDRNVKEFMVLAEAALKAEVNGSGSSEEWAEVERHPMFLGFRTFFRSTRGDCNACHRNGMLTDRRFHNIGLRQDGVDLGHQSGVELLRNDRFRGNGAFSDAPDVGNSKLINLYNEVEENSAESVAAFRTPSLRNVALTAPYMHDGQLGTLDDVIEFYDRGGDPVGTYPGTLAITMRPLDLTAEEKAALKTLLESLTAD